MGQLPGPALIGMESTGNCQWFVEMVTTAGHQVWIGDAAKIRASEVRQQKHDRRDAALILKLLVEGRFPRIWTPSGVEKDLRQSKYQPWCRSDPYDARMANLAKARKSPLYHPPRLWRSKEESSMVRLLVYWWLTSRDGTSPRVVLRPRNSGAATHGSRSWFENFRRTRTRSSNEHAVQVTRLSPNLVGHGSSLAKCGSVGNYDRAGGVVNEHSALTILNPDMEIIRVAPFRGRCRLRRGP